MSIQILDDGLKIKPQNNTNEDNVDQENADTVDNQES